MKSVELLYNEIECGGSNQVFAMNGVSVFGEDSWIYTCMTMVAVGIRRQLVSVFPSERIFVVVSRTLRALQRDNSRAKIHSHSTINKKVFSAWGNMLDNLSGNAMQLSVSS